MMAQKLMKSTSTSQILFGFTRPVVSVGRNSNPRLLLRGARNSASKESSFIKPIEGVSKTPFGVTIESGPVPPSRLWKPFVFTVAFSAGSIMGASIYEYENLRSRARRTIQNSPTFSWFKNKLNQKPPQQKIDLKNTIFTWWSNLSSGERVFAPLCALNIIVFGLWRIPRLQPTMIKYFCSNPAARTVCWPMFLSTFSHYSMFHIFANMYVLHSFSIAAVSSMGREQFLAMYLSAGVVSSFASYLYKVFKIQGGVSLGASGAIMAVLALVCAKYPDIQLSILFLPTFTFSAGSAIKVIMGFDLAGCLLGWKFFDHAAHLGGALFGFFWYYVGSEQIWSKRDNFLRYWHMLRTGK